MPFLLFCYFALAACLLPMTTFAPFPQVDCFSLYSFIVHTGTLIIVFLFVLPWLIVVFPFLSFVQLFFLAQGNVPRTTWGHPGQQGGTHYCCGCPSQYLGQQWSAWDNRRHPGQQEASGTSVWIVLIYVSDQVARCGDLLHRYVVDCCFVSCCITPVNYCF